MAIDTIYNYVRQSPTTITEELYTDVGTSFTLGLLKRAFLASGFAIRRTSGGTPLTLDVDYELDEKDAFYSQSAYENEDVYTKINILNSTYETGNLYVTYDAVLTYNTLEAQIYSSISYSKRVGELFHLDDYVAPAEFDATDADAFFPAVCLDAVDAYEDISSTNWSALVTHLRAKPLYYLRGKTGQKSAFDVTNWSVATNVGTLTFEDDTPENYILGGLAGDNLVHGSYSNWRTITLASAIGNIPAGDYAITAIDSLARTVTFAVTASDGSGAVTATASFYPHRIAGSTTTARLFEVSGKTIASPDSSDRVSGLRGLDQMQKLEGGFGVRLSSTDIGNMSIDGAFVASPGETGGTTAVGGVLSGALSHIRIDSSGSPNARTSATTDGETHGPEMVGHIYIWGRTYVA